jgi:hypothetical protein
MNGLGLAAPNRIRCQRTAVARPCGGSLRLRGLVVDTRICVRCGTEFSRPTNERLGQWSRRRYCSIVCYRHRESTPQAERFWRYVVKGAGCWEWQAALGGSGYGTFGLNRERMMPAHRFSWQLHFGSIPEGMLVCHHCDSRLCVRPDHLFLGTPLANTRDMDRKGRRVIAPCRGERNGNARLNEADIIAIRHDAAVGESRRAIAVRYGVTPELIGQIIRRVAWRHVA